MLGRNTPPEYDKKLNAQRLREGLENHILMVAEKAFMKHGKIDSIDSFLELLNNREIVRFPTTIDFNDLTLKDKQCSKLDKIKETDDECYRITLHPHFRGRDKDIIALALYQIVKVNYGKIAKEKEGLLFGASILAIGEDEYKEWLTKLESEI